MGCICLNLGESSTSEVDTGNDDALGDHLSKWVNDFGIKQNAVDSLLKILKECGHPNLPSSACTLLELYLFNISLECNIFTFLLL